MIAESGVANAQRPTRIDAHHHLWRHNSDEFGWLNDSMAILRRDFLLEDFATELAAAHMDAAIAVQSRSLLLETDFLLACAETSPNIVGVVGWAPLTSPDLPDILRRFCASPHLVGFREIAQGRAAEFFGDNAFNAGIDHLTGHGLAYDILIYADEIEEAARLVDRHPNQSFILDHAAKPHIAAGDIEPWRSQLRELSRRPNVACKLSGLVTEAHWLTWTVSSLRPYLETCVEAFTPQRLLAGSDWPVCLVACPYELWWKVLDNFFFSYTTEERDAVFGGNAQRLYLLPRKSNK
jgi:L-fuconolactonase